MNLDTPEKRVILVSNETQAVIDALASLSLEELASLYKITEERASEEEQRIRALKSGTAKTYPALNLSSTVSCTGISAVMDWTEAEAAYVQDHLLITSALYGVIPALPDCSPSFGLSHEA